ncbi:MAG: DNA repair protein RecO [Acidobacteria bacterium]|nr:DNA repair protein RecO [Acidobacteriota bacterium]
MRETEAMVLRSHPLGESDRIVTFLTRSSGKVRGVAKGARRSRRRFGSNLEPLSRVRLSYFEREGSELARIEGADLLESFYRLQEEPERGAVLACMAEVADAFAREQQEDEPYFRLLHAVLRAIRDGLDLGPGARYFEIWTLRLHGVLPPLTVCERCGGDLTARGGIYHRREGGVVCRRCVPGSTPGSVMLPKGALAAAAAILKDAPAALIGRSFAPGALGPLQGLAEALFFDLTERRFKSYEVLRALRGTSR